MFMRMDFLSGQVKTLTELSTYLDRTWPLGTSPYIYGDRFIRFLEEKYKRPFIEVYNKQSYRIWPFSVNKNIKETYGKDLSDLYKEWQERQAKAYSEEYKLISKNQLTRYSLVTTEGAASGNPRFSANGEELYFIWDSLYEQRSLSKIKISQRR